MTKYSTNSNNNTSTSCCFTGIFRRFNCTGNLPTHPSPPDNQIILEKPVKFHLSLTKNVDQSSNNVVDSRIQSYVASTQAQANNNPGIIAKLMGLETLPNNEKFATLDSLFRSKSLNSLNFLPDFDPTRAAFHRRARTSASFHEQGHTLLIKIDENLESDGLLVKESEMGYYESNSMMQRKKEREKEVVLKEKSRQSGCSREKISGSKKKYEECYTNGASRRSRRLNNNNVNNNYYNNYNNSDLREKCAKQKRKFVNIKDIKVNSTMVHKKKIGHNQGLCIEAHPMQNKLLSRSPVSVIEHHKEVTCASSKGKGRLISSSSRRKPTPKPKINENLPQGKVPKSKQNYEDRCSRVASIHAQVKAEAKVADYFVEMLGYICKLAEEHTRETNWVDNYEVVKVHFVEELSLHLGQEILDLLLDELIA